jgi:hypothetical protein
MPVTTRITRSASVRASSWNPDDRTVEILFLANEGIERKTWDGTTFREVIPMAVGRFDRFNGGASLFVDHQTDARNAIGVIQSWRRDDSVGRPQGFCTVRLTDAPGDADTVHKIIDGTLPGVSVGFDVDGWAQEVVDGVTIRTATGWEALEVSSVGVNADAGAHVRSHGARAMNDAAKFMAAIIALAGDDKPLSKVYKEVAKAAKLSPEDVKAFAEGSSEPEPEQLGPLAAALGLQVKLSDEPASTPAADEGGDDADDTSEAPDAGEPAAETEETPEAPRADEESEMPIAKDVAAETERASEITKLALKHGRSKDLAGWVADPKKTVDAVRALILADMAAADDSAGIRGTHASGTTAGEDAHDQRKGSFEIALYARGHNCSFEDAAKALRNEGDKPATEGAIAGARRFRGRSITEGARLFMGESGVDAGAMSGEELATAMLGGKVRGHGRATLVSADLPSLLLNVGNKSLLRGFDEYKAVYPAFTQQTDASNFNAIRPISASSYPALLEVPEGADYQDGVLSDGAETFTPKRYARVLKLSVEMMTKDDVGGLTRIPSTWGRRVARNRDVLTLGIVTANAALADGSALFHANHSNLAAGGDVALPTSASFAEARRSMRVQKNIDGGANDIENITPTILLVPAAQEDAAARLIMGAYDAATHANSRLKWIEGMDIVSHGLLDATSTTGWYMFADPNLWPVIQWCEVSGHGPRFDSEFDWDSDALKMKVVDSFGVGAVDYRGAYSNPGA